MNQLTLQLGAPPRLQQLVPGKSQLSPWTHTVELAALRKISIVEQGVCVCVCVCERERKRERERERENTKVFLDCLCIDEGSSCRSHQNTALPALLNENMALLKERERGGR